MLYWTCSSTAQHSTAQHSTAQHSTAQHSDSCYLSFYTDNRYFPHSAYLYYYHLTQSIRLTDLKPSYLPFDNPCVTYIHQCTPAEYRFYELCPKSDKNKVPHILNGTGYILNCHFFGACCCAWLDARRLKIGKNLYKKRIITLLTLPSSTDFTTNLIFILTRQARERLSVFFISFYINYVSYWQVFIILTTINNNKGALHYV